MINLLFSVRNLEEKFDNRAPVVIIIKKKNQNIYIFSKFVRPEDHNTWACGWDEIMRLRRLWFNLNLWCFMHCLFPFFSSLSFICPCRANNGRKRRHEEPEKKGSYDTFNLSKHVEKNVDQFHKMWVFCLKSHIAKVQFPAFTLSSNTHALLNHDWIVPGLMLLQHSPFQHFPVGCVSPSCQ